MDITGFTGTAPAYEVWLDATPILTPSLIIVPKKTLYGGGSIAPATDLIVYRRESGGQLTLLTYANPPVTNQYKLTGNVGPFTTAHNGDQTITVTDETSLSDTYGIKVDVPSSPPYSDEALIIVPKKTAYAYNTSINTAANPKDLIVYKRDQWGVLSELTGGYTVSPSAGLTPAGTKTITVTAPGGIPTGTYSVLVNPDNAPELYVIPKKTFYQQYDLTFRLANDAQVFKKESTGDIVPLLPSDLEYQLGGAGTWYDDTNTPDFPYALTGYSTVTIREKNSGLTAPAYDVYVEMAYDDVDFGKAPIITKYVYWTCLPGIRLSMKL